MTRRQQPQLTLTNKDCELLLSLSDSELILWMSQFNRAKQAMLLKQLIQNNALTHPLASPTAMGKFLLGEKWLTGPHLELLNEKLLDLAARKIKRLLVMMPPRHGKSMLVSHCFPAWYLANFPNHRVMLTSYEAKFAAGWGRQARDLFQRLFPKYIASKVRRDSHAAENWNVVGHLGGMVTAGVGGPLTGRGADLLIVDDPVKNAEQAASETYRERSWQWWTSTAFTRLEPNGIVVIVQTRWHEDDLAGRVLREQAGQQWQVVCLPAIAGDDDQLNRRPGEALWPARFPSHRLESIRQSLPTYWWQALYQQQPSHYERLLWPPEYFQHEDFWFDRWPNDLLLRVMALDPSKGKGTRASDYSAYVLLGVQDGGDLWVEADMSNSRTPLQMVDRGVDLFVKFRPDAFRVEGNAWQDLLEPLFAEAFRNRQLLHAPPSAVYNRINKRLRIESLDSLLASRQIHFRRTPGTELLVQQLKEFPIARHDDGPDALEMAVRTAQELWLGDDGEKVSSFNRSEGQQW